MKNVSLFLVPIAASVAFMAPVQAQSTQSDACAGVQWKDPRTANSCVDVVDRNGKSYVKLSGKVIKKGKISITVLLDKSKEELTWMPDLGEMVTISGKEVDPMTVEIGTELHFYVPKSQVATQ
jgi:hypothetical protein